MLPASTGEYAAPVHTDEQIISLNSHIFHEGVFRHALDDRSCQSHKPVLSPVHTLPVEVLSFIFQQIVSCHYLKPNEYRICIRQALKLSSVSAHFRHVALGTPELWKRIPFKLIDGEEIDRVFSLLQHCTALAPHINISVFNGLDEEEARLAIKVLLTTETMRKVKAFQLYYSSSGSSSNLWLEKLKGSSFPILDTLHINHGVIEFIRLNLGTLNTVTRLNICGPCSDSSIILPPSIQDLTISLVSQQMAVSLLQQCPNLVELLITSNIFDDPYDNTHAKPLTLNYLKKLILGPIRAIVECLLLPSLESLQFDHEEDNGDFTDVILLCRKVSSNLTNLTITTDSEILSLDYDFYQLCRLPFPNLVTLKFLSPYWGRITDLIEALAPLEDECNNNPERPYFPSLESVSVSCGEGVMPSILLLLLEEYGIGETFYFHIRFYSKSCDPDLWSPELREELSSIVGSRRVDIIWGDCQIHKVQELGMKNYPLQRDDGGDFI